MIIESIDIADMLSVYDEDCRERQANKAKFDERITRLVKWWGGRALSEINGASCRAYVKSRGNNGGARRDLEDLRAAINHHSKEGFHRGIVRVALPEKGLPRERWLERSEAAKLLWACWRCRETQTIHVGPNKGQKIETGKRPLRHIARFILIGLYTGTRAGAIASASPVRAEGRSYVDLGRGIFYRLAVGRRATTKRQTPVPLPSRLLNHLERWARLGISKGHFVEWNGRPVASVKTGFASAVRLAKLDVTEGNVTPHTLRHTAATWLMQAAAPMWEAAGFLGMSEKTLRETYGHHHPDYLRGAANAVGTRPAPNKNVALVDRLVGQKAVPSKRPQPVEIIGGPGRTRTCNQTVMSGRL
jgi:integrase